MSVVERMLKKDRSRMSIDNVSPFQASLISIIVFCILVSISKNILNVTILNIFFIGSFLIGFVFINLRKNLQFNYYSLVILISLSFIFFYSFINQFDFALEPFFFIITFYLFYIPIRFTKTLIKNSINNITKWIKRFNILMAICLFLFGVYWIALFNTEVEEEGDLFIKNSIFVKKNSFFTFNNSDSINVYINYDSSMQNLNIKSISVFKGGYISLKVYNCINGKNLIDDTDIRYEYLSNNRNKYYFTVTSWFYSVAYTYYIDVVSEIWFHPDDGSPEQLLFREKGEYLPRINLWL